MSIVRLVLALSAALWCSSAYAEDFLLEIWAKKPGLNPNVESPSGSGFWITQTGHAITAHHVVANNHQKGISVLARTQRRKDDQLPVSIDRSNITELNKFLAGS